MALCNKTITWLRDNRPLDMSGKTVVITGANSGIGFKSAEIMAFLGANVIMACRNEEKAEAAASEIRKDLPEANIRVMRLDLASLSSVHSFTDRIEAEGMDIDVFLSNAGVFKKKGMTTKDGFDLVLGTNYIGAYYLMELLLPYIKSIPHRVTYINTVSIIHKLGTVDYEDFFFGKRYGDLKVYARSKLCLAKYTYYRAKQYENSSVKIVMSHPGISITPLGANAFGKLVKYLSGKLGGLFNSPEKSALALPFILANDVPAGSITGPRGLINGWGLPSLNRTLRKVKTGGAELDGFTRKQIEKRIGDR